MRGVQIGKERRMAQRIDTPHAFVSQFTPAIARYCNQLIAECSRAIHIEAAAQMESVRHNLVCEDAPVEV